MCGRGTLSDVADFPEIGSNSRGYNSKFYKTSYRKFLFARIYNNTTTVMDCNFKFFKNRRFFNHIASPRIELISQLQSEY